MDITPINLDYLTRSLEDIANGEVARLELMVDELRENGRLCSEVGRELVAEFGYKGNLEEVAQQIEVTIKHIKDNGLSDLDRIEFQERRIKATESLIDDEFFNEKFKEAMEKGNLDEMADIIEHKENLHELLHQKKECLCYTNK